MLCILILFIVSYTDIQQQLFELYETEISTSFISNVTEAIIEDVKAWQNRPLESVYPIVFFDCIVVKVREDKCIINKAVYVALRYIFDWSQRCIRSLGKSK